MIFLAPIWIAGLIFTIIFTLQGIKAVKLFYKVKNLISTQIELEKGMHDRPNKQNSIVGHYSFDPGPWKKLGLKILQYQARGCLTEEWKFKEPMYKCFSPLIYCALFFLSLSR
jgi:hypothetical protein